MALRRGGGKYNLIQNLGNVSKAELEELRAETRRLAKTANQRLVRMERSGAGTSPAYKRAREDLATEFGAPRNRYRESVKNLTREELIDEYRSLREFISAKSSTVSGYEKIVNSRYKNFLEETGMKEDDISEENFVTAWQRISESEKAKELSYRAQFNIIAQANQKWKTMPAKEKEGRTFAEVMGKEIEYWTLRGAFTSRMRERADKS